MKRVAIVDFDVHHGNGTEDIVAGDQRILMASFYQHPFYPMDTVHSTASNLVNMPVPAYTKGAEIRELIETHWIPRLEAFRPEMIFISAGFDAHREDDMGQMGLVEQDYAWITQRLKDVAERHAKGRIVSCLGGRLCAERAGPQCGGARSSSGRCLKAAFPRWRAGLRP